MSNINAVPDPNLGILRKYSDGTANLAFQTNGANAVVINESQIANFVSTGAVTIPRGTTAQRPSSAVNGMFRANSNFGSFEVYLNGSWDNVTAVLTPINSVAPVVSGSAIVGSNVSVTNGTWNNSPTSYAYQWLANSTAISNATANVFTITSTQTGANLSCNVTATNAAGSNIPATSNSVGPVVATYTASYLMIAGGGGGGTFGGGGGAGGYLANTTSLTPGTTYTFVVGAGGRGGSAGQGRQGVSGSNTTFTGLTTAVGGGGGGDAWGGASALSGGSAGGTAGYGSGTAVAGQGNNGGTNPYAGGGGAGAQGGSGVVGSYAGAGGAGLASSITGSSVTRAGGGGASDYNGGGAAGGSGGGGNGAGLSNGGSGSVNTGGGGGSCGQAYTAGSGGSGVVILSVPTVSYSNVTTGSPTVTTSGNNTIMTFNSSGSYTA
jgi:hypothetical protein